MELELAQEVINANTLVVLVSLLGILGVFTHHITRTLIMISFVIIFIVSLSHVLYMKDILNNEGVSSFYEKHIK